MVFSSLHFLFLFLPLAMVAHLVVPQRFKNPVLFAFSLYFYAWGEPVYAALMLFSVAWNYLTGLQLAAPGAGSWPARWRSTWPCWASSSTPASWWTR